VRILSASRLWVGVSFYIMKKPKAKPAGLVFIDPKLVEEPGEDPTNLPLSLTCGKDQWTRVYRSDQNEAIYVWDRFTIQIDRRGYWPCIEANPLVPDDDPCDSFGLAVGIIRTIYEEEP
jgi:hypothetical protein